MAAVTCATCGQDLLDEFATSCPNGHEVEDEAESIGGRIRTREEVREARPETRQPAGGPAHVIISLDSTTVTFSGDEFVLGRKPGSQSPLSAALLHYPNVSRAHATVSVLTDHFLVSDVASTNNTFIDGNPIRGTGTQRLANGAVLRLARNCELTLTVLRPPTRMAPTSP